MSESELTIKNQTNMQCINDNKYEHEETGYLELIIGPMYAGKSTELIRIINRYKCLNKNIIIVNHILNNRYDSSGLTTHNRERVDNCIIVDKLNDIDDEIINNTHVIIIEELQFFQDAYNSVINWCDIKHKTVIAAGLDGDFLKNPFGDVLRLIPHAEKVTKLSALCKKCGNGTLAHFTKRITNDSQTTLVGSNNVYEAVCRKHFL
jgi:thymidine kinase